MTMTTLCECGCGNPAPIAKRNHSSWGWVKGQPMRFLRGHGNLGIKTRKPGPQYIIDPVTYCWNWQRYKDDKGYGVIKRRGQNYQAHRYFYEKHNGKIPEGLQLDHLCRNTSCVNPDHLEPVTGAENTRRGLNAKLGKEQVIEIKKRIDAGEKQTHLAKQFNVSAGCINAIAKGRAWE
jgi:hypothetical protein